MTITLFLLGLAVIFILFLIRYGAWGRILRGRSATEELQPISMPALHNLIDAKNLEFLRRSLPPSDFRRARRERNRVLRIYVHRIANNTRVLIAAAEATQGAQDPTIAESGRLLLAEALATRTLAVRALASLYIGEVFPGILPDLTGAVGSYQSAAARLDTLNLATTAH